MLKICFVSAYFPKRCGVVTYTDYLSNALVRNPGVKVFILSQKGAYKNSRTAVYSIPCFDFRTDYVDDIIKMTKEITPDIIHIQHTFGHYGGAKSYFLNFLRSLKINKCKVVITMHMIYDSKIVDFKCDMAIEDYNREIAKYVDKIIVHQNNSMKKMLIEQGIKQNKIEVIKHGVQFLKQISPQKAKEKMGFLVNDKVILIFGYIKRDKNIHVVIEALPSILRSIKHAKLFIAGWARLLSEEEFKYIVECKELVKRLNLVNHVKFSNDFIPEEKLPLVFSCADVVVLPYAQPWITVSGPLHLALGAHKPIVVSRIPKFDEVKDKISDEVLIDPKNREGFAKIIIRILKDKKFNEFVIKKIKEYASVTAWDKIAGRHLELYNSILDNHNH